MNPFLQELSGGECCEFLGKGELSLFAEEQVCQQRGFLLGFSYA